MRLIDADAKELVNRININFGGVTRFAIKCILKDAPAIDPASLRPKGYWNGEADGYADGELVYDVWYCSECNHCIDDGTDEPDMLPNFCPNCGADMRGANT